MMKRNTPFVILYEDEVLIAVNKGAGVLCGPERGESPRASAAPPSRDSAPSPRRGALAPPDPPLNSPRLDLLLRERSAVYRVHRLDRDTSGVVVFAKDREAHRRLSRVFEGREAAKTYLAVVHGRPSWETTECSLPLVPDGDKRHRTIIDRYRGKEALTRFRLLGGAGNYSVLEAQPVTGRTHQIRVHLASLGHPVVCDPLYGRPGPRGVYLSSFKHSWRGDPLSERPLLERLGLHATTLVLPGFGPAPPLTLHAPFPRDLSALLHQMKL